MQLECSLKLRKKAGNGKKLGQVYSRILLHLLQAKPGQNLEETWTRPGGSVGKYGFLLSQKASELTPSIRLMTCSQRLAVECHKRIFFYQEGLYSRQVVRETNFYKYYLK